MNERLPGQVAVIGFMNLVDFVDMSEVDTNELKQRASVQQYIALCMPVRKHR